MKVILLMTSTGCHKWFLKLIVLVLIVGTGLYVILTGLKDGMSKLVITILLSGFTATNTTGKTHGITILVTSNLI
jgi:hypothetical protein